MTNQDIMDLIESRRRWLPGDYINPCIIGERLVLQVTQRHEYRWGVWYNAKDAYGREMEVYVSDDPRAADQEQINEFGGKK